MTRARRKFGWLLLASAGRCALVDPGKLAASVAILHRLKPVPPTAAKYLVKSGTRFSLCLLAEKEEPVANRIDQAVGNFKPATFGRYPISGRLLIHSEAHTSTLLHAFGKPAHRLGCDRAPFTTGQRSFRLVDCRENLGSGAFALLQGKALL